MAAGIAAGEEVIWSIEPADFDEETLCLKERPIRFFFPGIAGWVPLARTSLTVVTRGSGDLGDSERFVLFHALFKRLRSRLEPLGSEVVDICCTLRKTARGH